MAKYDDFDLDADLDKDLDDYFGTEKSGDFKATTRAGKAREATTAFAGGVVSGVGGLAASNSFKRRLIESALPSNYGAAMGRVDTAIENSSRELAQLKKTHIGTGDGTGGTIASMVDRYAYKLPRRLRGPIKGWSERLRGNSGGGSGNEETDLEGLEGAAAISELFANNKAAEDSNLTRRHQVRSEEVAVSSNRTLGNLSNAAARIISYNDKIDYPYKKRSLELQYRQLFVQRKLLDVTESSQQMVREAFVRVIENTALPDIVKMKKPEIAKQIVTERVINGAVDGVSDLPKRLIKSFAKNVTNNVQTGSSEARNAIQLVSDQIEQMGMMADMMDDMGGGGKLSKISMAGSSAVGMFSSIIGDRLGKRLAPHLAKSGLINQGDDVLGTMMKRGPRSLVTKLRSAETGNTYIDKFIDLFDLDENLGRRRETLWERDEDTLDDAAFFDQMSKKALTHVIPGYLRHIHAEINHLRTGKPGGEIEYDYAKNTFVASTVIDKRMRNLVDNDAMGLLLRNTRDSFDEKLNLKSASAEVRAHIISEMTNAALHGEDIPIAKLLKSDKLSNEQMAEVRAILSDQLGITRDDDYADGLKARVKLGYSNLKRDSAGSKEQLSRQRELIELMDVLGDSFKGPAAELRQYARRRDLGRLMSLGVVTEDNGNYLLDGDVYRKHIEDRIDTGMYDEIVANTPRPTSQPDQIDELLNPLADGIKTRVARGYAYTKDKAKAGYNHAKNFIQIHILERLANKEETDDSLADVNPSDVVAATDELIAQHLGVDVADVDPDTLDKPLAVFVNNAKQWRERMKNSVTKSVNECKEAGVKGQLDKVKSTKERAHKHVVSYVKKVTGYVTRQKLVESVAILGEKYNQSKAKQKIDGISDNMRNRYIDSGAQKRVDDARAKIIEKYETSGAKNKVQSAQTRGAEYYQNSGLSDGVDKVREQITKENLANLSQSAREQAEDTLETLSKNMEIMRADTVDAFVNRVKDHVEKTGKPISQGTYENLLRVWKIKGLARNGLKWGVDQGVEFAKYSASGAMLDDLKSSIDTIKDKASFVGAFADYATRPSRAMLRLMGRIGKSAVTRVDNNKFDKIEHGLWLKNEREPRLLKTKLEKGMYLNQNGDTVESGLDLIGDIYDVSGDEPQLVLSSSEYRSGLYDSTGKLWHKPVGIYGKAVGLVVRGAKGVLNLAKKATIGYLKVTTKPVTWLIDSILRDDRIDPKLHAELVALGLTEQTNQKLDAVIEKLSPEETKYNDKDKDGERDGGLKDMLAKFKRRKENKSEDKDTPKTRGKDKDEADNESGGLLGMLGNGFSFLKDGLGKIFANPAVGNLLKAGIRNPYVLAALVGAGIFTKEWFSDHGIEDPDDVAGYLPEFLQDSKTARSATRAISWVGDKVIMGNARNTLKGANWLGNKLDAMNKWAKRRGEGAREVIGNSLNKLGASATGFLFGEEAGNKFRRVVDADYRSALFRMRMAQYGVSYRDQSMVDAITKFEADLLSTIVPATKTRAAQIPDKVTVEQSVAYFNVNINDDAQLGPWSLWFAERFKPVFLSSVTIMDRMGVSGKRLHQVDSLLNKEQKLEFVSRANFTRVDRNPYDVSASPMGGDWSLDYSSATKVYGVVDDVIKEIRRQSDGDKEAIKRRDTARVNDANSRHDKTVAQKYFDFDKAVDEKVSVRGILKGVGARHATEKNNSLNKFSGAGAGGKYDTSNLGVEETPTTIKDGGIVGKGLSMLGGLFISKAHAGSFRPELMANPANQKILATRANGSDVLSKADKPLVVARKMREYAASSPSGNSAAAMHKGLVASGFKVKSVAKASEYVIKVLPDIGFAQVPKNTPWVAGDIMVFAASQWYKHGHIQVYDGANWISDYIQESWMPFDKTPPTFTLWRNNRFQQKSERVPKLASGNPFSKDEQNSIFRHADKDGKSSVQTTRSNTKQSQTRTDDTPSAWEKFKSSVGDFGASVKSGFKRVTGFFGGPSSDFDSLPKDRKAKFKEIMKLAARGGDPHPAVLAAQWALESGWGKSHSGRNNLFGIKATKSQAGSAVATTEVIGGVRQSTVARFRDYASVQESMADRIRLMQNPVYVKAGYQRAKTAKDAAQALQGTYATDPQYASKLVNIINSAGVDPSKNSEEVIKELLGEDIPKGNTAARGPARAPTSDLVPNMSDALSRYSTAPQPAKSSRLTPEQAAYQYAAQERGDKGTQSGSQLSSGTKPAIAAAKARRNARKGGSSGYCARYVRIALQAAGYKFTPQPSAYQYETNGTLSSMGFGQIATSTPVQVGDVIVIRRTAPHPHGHICIWDGKNWISDFVQSGWNPYRGPQQYTLWRDRNHLNGAKSSSGPTASTKGGSVASESMVGGGAAPYNPVAMVYNDYTGIDEKLAGKKSSDTTTAKAATKPTDTAVSSKVDSKATDKAKSQSSGGSVSTASKVTQGSSVDTSGAKSVSANDYRGAADNAKWREVEYKARERAERSMSNKMAESGQAASSQKLDETNQILRSSLKTLGEIAGTLKRIEQGIGKQGGQSSNTVTNPRAESEKPVQRVQDQSLRQQVNYGDIPMSMRKV